MSATTAHIGLLRAQGVSLLTFVEMVLTAGLIIAVLAFGGTEFATFSVVEVLFAGLAVVCLASPKFSELSLPRSILAAGGLLLAVVLLQLCPIPVSWVHVPTGATPVVASGARLRTLSIDPFATRTQLLVLVTCLIAFFAAYLIGRDSGRRRRFVISIIGVGLFEALYGLVQYLTGWQKIFGYQKKFDLEEATGTYINRNHYAGLLEMVLPLALAFAFYELVKANGRRRSRPAMKQLMAGSGHKIVLWLAISVVIFAALVCSRSRMGLIAASLAVLPMIVLACTRRVSRRAGLVLCAAFLLLTTSLVGWLGAASVVERFQGVSQEYSQNDHSRLSIWRDTVHLIRQHPLLGTGFGTFPIAFTSEQTSFLNGFVNHAHNDYLELASELGIPLAAGVTAFLLWLLARAVRLFLTTAKNFDGFLALGAAGSMTAILLHSLADFNLCIPANLLLFGAISGLILSLQPAVPGAFT